MSINWAKWLRSQIQKHWSKDKWNKMYKKTESSEIDTDTIEEVEEWNGLYDTVKNSNNQAVIEWNEIANK